MATVEQLRSKLIEKLKELFQLNQPDLDFGFYRIMHAKSDQVIRYLENDLPRLIAEQFDTRSAQLAVAALEEAKASVIRLLGESAILSDGTLAEQYANTPFGLDYLTKRRQAVLAGDTAAAEAQVYDHLYRFFERYYDDGDFISRRYYARETQTRAAPYALPYSGEEVKLVWANMDQYYIKTTEYFSNFTFDLAKSEQAQAVQTGLFGDDAPAKPYRVHFQIAEATEGEHGNIKASDQTKRYFLIHEADPVTFDDQGEFVCRFEYRPDPEKSGQDATWRDKRNGEAVETILDALRALAATDERAKVYLRLLETPAPAEKDPKRPLLAKYVNQYTARNTMDYFIHKDLGAFLRRELDFYIKNEVVRLDDIEQSDAPRADAYLGQVRILRRIAGKLIDFLAQLEDFQKRLWLKKKFVVETNYCITLDRIIAIEDEAERNWLLEQIATNDAQREEWVKLFAIDNIENESDNPGYSNPLTVDFLRTNRFLVIDTHHFKQDFVARLAAAVGNIGNPDGWVFHCDNFHALGLVEPTMKGRIDCIYIDPPYNTGPSEILYKNAYKDASWLTLLENRLRKSAALLSNDGILICAIDDFEMPHLCELMDSLYPAYDRDMVVVNHHPQGGYSANITRTHEYALFMIPKGRDILKGKRIDESLEHRPFMRSGTGENNFRGGRPNSFYAILVDPSTQEVKDVEAPPPQDEDSYPTAPNTDGWVRIYPIGRTAQGQVVERVWRLAYESGKKAVEEKRIISSVNGTIYQVIEHEDRRSAIFSNWTDKRYNAGTNGSLLLANILGTAGIFSYPKSLYTVRDSIEAATISKPNAIICDYFAGSGTTAHAVIDLNREDELQRRYILMESASYFDEATIPRLKRIVYSSEWQNGLPVARNSGISHCFKYVRLESYEDCLNNLEPKNDAERDKALAANPDLAEEYLLHYMLDVETASSPSLLNIDGFADPTTYRLKVKQPGTDVYAWRSVDLLETFNYLLGLRVDHIAAQQTFMAEFERPPDPELPEDQHTRLQLVRGAFRLDPDGPWWFRKVEGWLPKDFKNPDNGQRERVLIVWRKLTGDAERDNLMLDEWFRKNRIDTKDWEFGTIYVNGSNNLPNLRQEGDSWKVRLIEEDFLRLMWDTEGL